MPASFPFTAILGQEAMQTALLICAVDPAIGGVLVRGQKGTAKSTAARALADLLPPIAVVAGCAYHCAPDCPAELCNECHVHQASNTALEQELVATPFVDLPLSTTEDRLVGTLHLEETLLKGRRKFEPGLFAAAHRGILYVDEVNLLPDHLVDLLLDTAVSGNNIVEREGLQYRHDSRFILIGTMNPEEGELRPQFLDRFGLCVTIAGLEDPALRREIVLHRLAYDSAPDDFAKARIDQQNLLRQQVFLARQRLGNVALPTSIVDHAVAIATRAKVYGHRAELALIRSARALAALLDRDTVTLAELNAVAGYALAHRIPGPAVLSQEEVNNKLASLLENLDFSDTPSERSRDAFADPEEVALMENIDFPGSAAAGSMLFTYLKKKLKTASSLPTTHSI